MKLELDVNEINFVLQTLGELPSKSGVWPLILKIKEQAETQLPKEAPKINLVGGGEFAEIKTSLGGFDPETKEIYVATENRLTADILRTLAHEMVHRKQDEMGLVRNPNKDGMDGSPIENNAHAVAGILMREYGNAIRY